MSYTQQLQRIVDRYQRAAEPWPATTRAIARWAIGRGLWVAQPASLEDQCASQLARAMREEYVRDPQGRTVRAKHAARMEQDGEQLTFWADIRTAGRAHMEIAFQQRRQQVLSDCRQLKSDVDSYNDNANSGKAIQMIFDFTLDLEEEALAAAR